MKKADGSLSPSHSSNSQEEPLSWQTPRVACKSNNPNHLPSARAGHTITLNGNTCYVFGGLDGSKPPGPTNDIYLLKMGTKEFEWERLPVAKDVKPPSRWRHTANLVEHRIIVFGGFHSTMERFNDVWVFDPVTLEWSQPQAQLQNTGRKSIDGSMKKPTWPHQPPPRGGHSATAIGTKLWVFGGYGGMGYSRRDLDDLHTLDTERWSWAKVTTKGKCPEKRSNHSAVAVETSLYVFGGGNSVQQFKDLFILDTEMDPPTWTNVDNSMREARWSYGAVAVMAIPFWKIFIFGGKTGQMSEDEKQGNYSNDLAILDTGNLRWTYPEIAGALPPPRADCAMEFDAKLSRLIVFGGWQGEWFGDISLLDVGCIVGPPYAITDVFPSLGPITGGTHMEVMGIDFVNADVVVRFASRKGFVDVKGVFVNGNKVTVVSPDFQQYPAGTVDIRVSLGGDSFTTTFGRFTYFPVTAARWSLMYGPGLLEGGAANEEAIFFIQARTQENVNRTTGGDDFKVVVLLQAGGDDGRDLPVRGVTVQDQENGRYLVSFVPKVPGTYIITAEFMGTFGGQAGHIRGSPAYATFDDFTSRENNSMMGKMFVDYLKSSLTFLSEFTKATYLGLLARLQDDTWTQKDVTDAIVRMREHIMNVEVRGDEILLSLDRCREVVENLKGQGVNTSSLEAVLDGAKQTWDSVLKEVPNTIIRVNPLVKAHAIKMKQEIQKYEEKVKAYLGTIQEGSWRFYETGHTEALDLLQRADVAYAEEARKCEEMVHLANIFECPRDMQKALDVMHGVRDLLADYKELWELGKTVEEFIALCKESYWVAINPDGMEEIARDHVAALKRLPKSVRESGAYSGLDKTIKDFIKTCPLIAALRHPAMRDRHWQELMLVTGKSLFELPSKAPQLRLTEVLDLELHNFVSDVEDITDKAMKELKQEESLQGLEKTWAAIEFVVSPYKDTDVPLLRLADQDFETLEADQLSVQSMAASRYVFFKAQSLQWHKALSTVAEVVQILGEVQRVWSYLEPLFVGSEEVRKELPNDAKRFSVVDAQVRDVLRTMSAVRNVKSACNQAGLFAQLEKLQRELEVCKKSLVDFLDGKRRLFPRFYFTSEADLLDILSNGSSPYKIMKHVEKVLLATKSLDLKASPDDGGRPTAVRFTAGVGDEDVGFESGVALEGKVEVYLQSVLTAQIKTLAEHLSRSLKRYPSQLRVDWLLNKQDGKPSDAAQIALLVAGVQYVIEVEAAMDRHARGELDALQTYLDIQIQQLNSLIRLTQRDLTRADRQRIMCMITLDAHNRDVVIKLMREQAVKRTDFQWQSQLKPRYVVKGKDGHQAEFGICDAKFQYGFEYLGNGPRLVITPLTDRIYVTATQALHLHMGCAPAGPAGTGKTETTKDLAAALGKCCYVFNCSPEMDYQSLGNIFKGLASSGSWGCFDEFNRLIPEVLSVCSVQFKAVCDGMRHFREQDSETHRITIEGDAVNLDPTCGAFITMNPGYLGRSELPEGLKALFRPITVMVPDLVLICENMLMAEGFVEAKVLASKFYGLYSLLQELLSKQDHYDWGMRAVKSVLVVAGHLKRREPSLSEETLLMRALRDFNTPKIVQADEVIFSGLLNDLFPGLNPPQVIDKGLDQCAILACQEQSLWPEEAFRLKVLQLDELLAIRHCVFLIGNPGSGKTACWKTLRLAKSLKDPHKKVKVVDLNPKTMPTEDLYGHISLTTREWKDGLLSSIMRDLGQIADEKPKWILLDGDLDANWIESMNSVMDDNKMLTLASNERIPLKHYMRMVFEIRDLRYATPATVSRAGVLYIPTDSGAQWRSLIASWVQSRPDSIFTERSREVIRDMFDKYVPDTLGFFRKEVKTILPREEVTLVASLLRLLQGIINADVARNQMYLEHAFVFAAIWAFGSALYVSDDGIDYRAVFSDWWRSNFKSVRLPARETVFDYWLDVRAAKFDVWKASPIFKAVEFDSRTQSMSEVTVPTPETASLTYWMKMMVKSSFPVLLAGPAGTGKTQLINGMLRELKPEERVHSTINMNYYTNASALQVALEANLVKRTGVTYGPSGSVLMVYFVDDLNLPEVDAYNTQSAIALMRQHMDYGHWYDLTKLQLKQVVDCQYVAAMNPTAGSFQVNPRLQRHFTTFAVGMPSATSLLTIFQTFMDGHLTNYRFEPAVASISPNLIKASLAMHKEVSEAFRKTAANFHYEFSIRHLSNVCQGILMSRPANFPHPERLVALWLHETERVYGDRLVSQEDIDRFKTLLLNQGKKAFPQYNVHRFYMASGQAQQPEPLLFCHFVDGLDDDSGYGLVTSMDRLQGIVEGALADYNESNAFMDLILFEDAIGHVLKITRIIKQDAGHALLVGVGGSGKQSLSRLAASMCGYSVVQLTITHSYSTSDLKADLQAMYYKAGVKGEGVVFMLNDSQIANERFLVYINDLLGSARIPDLYTNDELEGVISATLPRAKAKGFATDPASVFNYFISQVRLNLHCVLCFSPVGVELRSRSRKFPAIVNCTVIDWFQPWPKNALAKVAKKFLANLEVGDAKVRAGIEAFMPYSFETVNAQCRKFQAVEGRYVYTTPKSYLELLKLYNTLLRHKRVEVEDGIARLVNGVDKLRSSAEAVSLLEKNLTKMLEEAEAKRKLSEVIATQVASEREKVQKETEKANVEARKVSEIQQDVARKQADAEADLALAEPAVQAAMAALDTLDKKDLGTCKTMAKPPPGVGDIFSAVVVLMAGVNPQVVVQKNGKVKDKDRSWDAAKKALLSNVNGFVDELKEFKTKIDEGSVPDVNFKEIRPFLQLEHFNVETIEKRNSSSAGLCSWVLNIVKYYDIVLEVEPKRQLLREATKQLETANKQLEAMQARVAELQAQLDQLTADYEAADQEMRNAKDEAERGKLKLELAARLIKALGSEKARWSEGIASLQAEKEVLVGDVLLASAFISYIAPFTKPFREELVRDSWVPFLHKAAGGNSPIPMSTNADPMKILANEADIAAWNNQGLPADPVSCQNGAIVECSARYSLLIDPQLQGVAWIKNKESSKTRNLQVTRLDQPDYLTKLEAAITNGWSLLIENMGEKIDPILMPVISRVAIKKGRGTKFLKLGSTEVELHPDFRLFLHTKLSNPHYPPEIQAEATLVNFTVTPQGLEDQLLALVIRKERADLANKQAALIQQRNIFKVRIKQLEDDILIRLSSAEGDITEDRGLIEGLERAKSLSDEIKVKLEQGIRTAESITRISEKYRSVARRTALLFFIMNDLNKMHSYYMYSLFAFVVFFSNGMERAGKRSGSAAAAAASAAETDAGAGGGATAAAPAAKKRGPQRPKASAANSKSPAEGGGGSVVSGSKFSWDPNILKPFAPTSEAELVRIIGADSAAAANGKDMSDEEIEKRCLELKDSITSTIFNYIREGLFEKDRLTVLTMMAFQILQDEGTLDPRLLQALLLVGPVPDPPPIADELKPWLPESVWSRLAWLERVLGSIYPNFSELCEGVNLDAEDWENWYNSAAPEADRAPGKLSGASELELLVLLRVMRPDRLAFALRAFVSRSLGESYVYMPPFDMRKTYEQSCKSTPIFFVLFPGVDPTPWVEELGASLNITMANGLLANISMGQGQEKPAEATLERMAKAGGWVLLQNVHLMQSWLVTLERQLEALTETADIKFRCFISAEPPPLPYLKNIPEGLLQSSLKVANELPADLQSNFRRAWAKFSDDRFQDCRRRDEFKACLFGLCFYHSVILGRRRFGSQGWSCSYGFNLGDLTICANVLQNYLNHTTGSGAAVPWQDLRYIFGEIMYGGHITDYWDRRTNNTYLEVLFNESLLSNGRLAPGFVCPDPRDYNYRQYSDHIEKGLKDETPVMYGMHPNAEIGYLTSTADSIFATILRLRVGSSSSGAGSGSGGDGNSPAIKDAIADLLTRLPRKFAMMDINDRAQEAVQGDHGPFVVVGVQECGRMNRLLEEVERSLVELRKGLNGQLNMSQAMEDLNQSISINEVPGRSPFHMCSWEKFAWPSRKQLSSWFVDMICRVTQLQRWAKELKLPYSMWLPGLFNPTAFLTAIKQVTARRNGFPLDKVTIETHVTRVLNHEDITAAAAYPPAGVYVHGLFMQGARWLVGEEAVEAGAVFKVDGTVDCAGVVVESRLKELMPPMPVMYVKAIPVEESWQPDSVGYLRPSLDCYNCPVYVTTLRGATYTFLATLKTREARAKWILAGVALIMQTND